jgi:paraquat-inducible protein B
MSDTDAPDPQAETVRSRRFQPVWLIPIVAALIAGYLAFTTIYQRGPLITIVFNSADGLKAGQTKVRHKAVDLGTVESIRLADDLTHVVVEVRMQREATAELTDQARFWVVRPRLTAGNISGLDTLVSGAYIEMDPGAAGSNGKPARQFDGLEDPPAVRSDEPGTAFTLTSDRIGGLASGSPVLYRDINVGEVLNWELDPDGQGFKISVFVRRPYDKFVHAGTHFWNASGIELDLGANGVQLKVQNLQAVLSGAVAFDTAVEARNTPPSKGGTMFELYPNGQAADSASYAKNLPFLTRFDGSVRGLAVGAPVEFYGIQIGAVTGIRLVFDPTGVESYVDVSYDIQPERLLPISAFNGVTPLAMAQNLVKRGMRAQLHTANYLTGQLYLGLDIVPSAAPAEATEEADGTVVLPGVSGGLDNLTATITALTAEVAKIPFAQIGADLESTLHGLSGVVNGQELKDSLTSLAATLKEAQALVAHLDDGAAPVLKRLPEISRNLDTAMQRTSALIQSAEEGYGAQSQTRRDLDRLISQATDTARSLRQLADFLKDHPEALIQGRTAGATDP